GAALNDAPWTVLDGIDRFPPAEPDLPPATPLAPLLVGDGPEALSVMHPPGAGTRVTRGGTLGVRFNRPMVRGSEVGHELARAPVSFVPPVPGTWRWATRSSLVFVPAAAAFDRNLEAALAFAEDLASLDGEPLYDD